MGTGGVLLRRQEAHQGWGAIRQTRATLCRQARPEIQRHMQRQGLGFSRGVRAEAARAHCSGDPGALRDFSAVDDSRDDLKARCR
eukprot:503242-Rhodomonas_salina.3